MGGKRAGQGYEKNEGGVEGWEEGGRQGDGKKEGGGRRNREGGVEGW
jgi:hypothetical protein